jgi:hypothetical protein
MTQWPALTILPDLVQPVHTFIRLAEPLTRARTRWMFGFQRRLVRIWECDTLRPHDGCFPHNSQTDAMVFLSSTNRTDVDNNPTRAIAKSKSKTPSAVTAVPRYFGRYHRGDADA